MVAQQRPPPVPPSPHPPPSFERDAVRLRGLRRRADLNDCHGIVLAKLAPDAFAVRLGTETVRVKWANLVFVGHVGVVMRTARLHALGGLGTDPRKLGLVLDDALWRVYMGDATPLTTGRACAQSDP